MFHVCVCCFFSLFFFQTLNTRLKLIPKRNLFVLSFYAINDFVIFFFSFLVSIKIKVAFVISTSYSSKINRQVHLECFRRFFVVVIIIFLSLTSCGLVVLFLSKTENHFILCALHCGLIQLVSRFCVSFIDLTTLMLADVNALKYLC